MSLYEKNIDEGMGSDLVLFNRLPRYARNDIEF